MTSTNGTHPPVISIKNVIKSYGHDDVTITALDIADLTIKKGEFVAIMGPSGCGKTTLLNILGLLDTPTDGEYLLDGHLVANMSEKRRAKLRRDHIGMVFQSFNLMDRLTILENVCLPLTYSGRHRVKRLITASDMLKKFALQEREYYLPNQLSGGQLQRVAIARALVNTPSIVLADEPTGNLDSKASELIMRELSEIHKDGNTIVMVTHNPDLTVWADRIIKMVDGKIASDTSKFFDKKEPKKRPLNKLKTRRTRAKKGAKK